MSGETASDETVFDPAAHGLLSHYSDRARTRIRRTILEDWQASGIKLPTYMKLLARYIVPTKRGATPVPEDWLAKLSHQTMAKMLAGTSTPRYEFWACLHLYLTKKYGPLDIDPEITDEDILGQALVRFGRVTTPPDAGHYAVKLDTLIALECAKQGLYALVTVTRHLNPNADQNAFLTIPTQSKAKGVAIAQGEEPGASIHLILRDILTREISFETLEPRQLKDLQNAE